MCTKSSQHSLSDPNSDALTQATTYSNTAHHTTTTPQHINTYNITRRQRQNCQHYTDQNCRAALESWFCFGCLFDVVLRDKFPRTWSLVLLNWFGEEWNTSKTKSQRSSAGIPSMRKPASREMISASVELCETEVCFLHIQLMAKRVTSENTQNSPWCGFWVFKVSCKIRVLIQSKSRQTSSWVTFLGPSASCSTFSVSTITDGSARAGSRSSYLPLRRPDCTLNRLSAEEYDQPVTQSTATPEPSRTIPTLDQALVAHQRLECVTTPGSWRSCPGWAAAHFTWMCLACSPGRTSRIGEDCHPRTTWRPLTLAGSPILPPCISLEVFCRADLTAPRQDVNSAFSPCMWPLHLQMCLHTRSFGTLTSPTPPVRDRPWGLCPSGHPGFRWLFSDAVLRQRFWLFHLLQEFEVSTSLRR